MGCVNVEDDLTIFTAEQMKPKVMQWLADESVSELDLSAVSEMDTAGFQLLLLMLREAGERATSLRFTNFSDPVQEVVAMYGYEEQFSQGV